MSDRYRIVAHHIFTDRYWFGAFESCNDTQLEEADELLKEICKRGANFTLYDVNGSKFYFPKNLIQECVFILEKSHEND